MSRLVSARNYVVFLGLGCAVMHSHLYADTTIGYWRFEETSGATAFDSSSFGNNGSLIGGASRSADVSTNPVPQTGSPNTGSVTLAPTGAYIDVPDDPVLNPKAAITVEATVRLTGTPASFGTAIVSRQYGDSTSDSFQLHARNNNSSIAFDITNAASKNGTAEVFVGLTPGKWYDLVGTYDGTAVRLYINGVLATQTALSGDIGYAVSKPLQIGADNEGGPITPTFAFPGNIDEVRISNVALSPSQFLAPPTPGDANGDRNVNGADYAIWADHFLQTGKNWSHADFTGDGLVDGADYTVWADHFAPFGLQAAAVPEPSALALAGIGVFALVAARRRTTRWFAGLALLGAGCKSIVAWGRQERIGSRPS